MVSKAKGAIRCFLIIVVLYLITICLVYNCILELKFRSELTSAREIGQISRTTAQRDLYKLRWSSKDNVFLKKVRNVNKAFPTESASATSKILNSKPNKYRLFKKVTKGFYIVSAFRDNRLATPYVRIIATLKKYSTYENDYWCHFQISDAAQKYAVYVSSKLIFYEMCENHKRSIGGWILSCEVPAAVTLAPSEFEISTSRVYQKNRTRTTIVLSSNTKYQGISYNGSEILDGTIGLCVPPLYGEIKPKAFVEFIEFSRLLGIQKLIFYVFEIQDDIRRILQYYESLEYIDSIAWDLPFNRKLLWNYGQSLAVNDCLYRYMNKIDYLAFLDIDEILVPRQDDKTWRDTLQRLSQLSQSEFAGHSGFSFRSTFFDPEFSDLKSSKLASSVVRVNRTKRFSYFRNKMLVRPSRIFELGIHHVSRSWPDDRNYTVANVDPGIAAVFHYRTCITEFGINCKALVEDLTVPLKYGKDLSDNIQAVMMKIMR